MPSPTGIRKVRGDEIPIWGVDRKRLKFADKLVKTDSEAFLRRFRDAAHAGSPLAVLAADVDGFAAALTSDPDGLEAAMALAAGSGGGHATVPASAFASAACTRDGRIIAVDDGFAGWHIPPGALATAVRGAGSDSARLSAIADDAGGRPVALAIASGPRALGWPLGESVRAALLADAADYAVLGVRAADGIDWSRLFGAWVFSKAETRLAAALVRTGDLRRAAGECGIAYETARETLAAAMAKTGARRQPEFVRQLAQLAFGDLPTHDATWRTFADAFDLGARQARLAQLVALGATRAAAAEALGISDQSAKADLKLVYERCGIDGGAALGRLVAEVDALARLAAATDVEIKARGSVPEPLRFVRRRRAPGRIAVEDHGPFDALPVIVCHVPLNGRHLPKVLVAALQARGLRPISVERPGFGLTTAAIGDVVGEANADLIDVLDALGLSRVRLLGRSAIMPLSFAAAHPDRVDRGVLLSSLPPGVRVKEGMTGAVVRLVLDQPRLVDGFARMLTRLSSDTAIERLTERTIGNCASDRAAFADPINRRDFIRASRQSSSGDGFAREIALHADGGTMPPVATTLDWTVVMGDEDANAAGVDDGLAQWQRALPRGRFVIVPGGGRFLHLSHPEIIAEALL